MVRRGRPKTEKGQKVLAGLKLFPNEKERAAQLAQKQGYSLSQYCRLAVLERLERDEKLQAQIKTD